MRLLPSMLVVAALAAPATASAAFPGTNGPIVFDRGGFIFSGSTQLRAGGTDYQPKVSPDGSQIAWLVNRDIWVMDADGSDARQVTQDGASNAEPDWSPDGKRLAYSGVGVDGRADLFVIPVAGGTPRAITSTADHGESDPAFSPDGTKIAYTRTGCEISEGGGTCVYVTSATGAGATNLTPEDSVAGCENQPGYFFDGSSRAPSWSPDGSKIAFQGPLDCKVSKIGSDIWVMTADGAGKTNLTHDDGTNDVEPAFSPDGTAIAFARNTLSGPTNVFVLSSAGITQVSSGGDDRNPDWGVAPKQCLVPKLKKAKLADAKARLTLMGCRAGDVTRKATKAAKGTVVAQAKAAGTRLKAGARIDLTVDR